MKLPMTPHPIEIAPGFAVHTKTLRAGNLAVGVFIRGLALSALNLSDGFVSSHDLQSLVETRGVLVETQSALVPMPVSVEYIAERLVEAELWRPAPGGFVVHEYELYQPTRALLEQRRVRDRDRKKRVRSDSARTSVSGSSSVEVLPSATATVLPPLTPSAVADKDQDPGEPLKGTPRWFAEQLRGSDSRTPAAIASVTRRWGLPEAALHAALEVVRERQPRSEPGYFIRCLEGFGREGRYAGREVA